MTASLYARFYLLPSALRRLFLMLAVGAIVLESFWPGHAVSHSPWMSFLANLMHPLLYGTFAFAVLLRLDLQAPLRASARGAVLAIVGLVGGLDEWHQVSMPWRDGSVGDWVSDLFGASTAVWLASRWCQPVYAAWRFGAFLALLGILAWTSLLTFGLPSDSLAP